MVDRVGKQFAGYRLIQQLGGGHFGDVYLGERISDTTPAAVKILKAHLTDNEDLKDFIHEVSALFRLQHPHIIRLLGFDMKMIVLFSLWIMLPTAHCVNQRERVCQ